MDKNFAFMIGFFSSLFGGAVMFFSLLLMGGLK